MTSIIKYILALLGAYTVLNTVAWITLIGAPKLNLSDTALICAEYKLYKEIDSRTKTKSEYCSTYTESCEKFEEQKQEYIKNIEVWHSGPKFRTALIVLVHAVKDEFK